MTRLLTLLLCLLLCTFSAWAANTPPPGSNGNLIVNNGNGQYGVYVVGGGLAITTSGGVNFLNATASGSAAPAGVNGAIQYNASGLFGGYGIGSGLSVVGGNLVASGAPGGSNGFIQYNNGGVLGGYSIGSGLAVVGGALVSTATGGSTVSPGGTTPQIQYNSGGSFAGMAVDTAAAYAAHDTVMNGTAYDPRNSTYGAICGGFNDFSGDGSTKTFNYTIPFAGSSSTDNTHFFVYIETNGFSPATVLNTSQFTVTGVNSGIGGTITLTTAPASGATLIVVHDDGPGLIAASTAAVASGGYVAVPDGCTMYTSQTSGTQLADGAQLIGQGFTPNYQFQGLGIKPILYVIAPTGVAPNYGFNVTGLAQQFFEGFEITSHVAGGNNSFGFQTVPVLIGAGTAGAGGGELPGITAQYMTFNYGSVGFGSSISGGTTGYIFGTLRFNNFIANNTGAYGALSDMTITGNDFSQNGGFGSYGTAGGLVVIAGTPGGGGAGKIATNRFEFNLEGVVLNNGFLITFDGNEFDSNTGCGLDLAGPWGAINVTGGWFRASGTNGNGGTGNTTAGRDAHVCVRAAGSGLHFSNVNFLNGYGRGYTAPIGSANANTPLYVLDVTTSGGGTTDIRFADSDTVNSFTSGAYVTDFAIYRNGMPPDIVVDSAGQAVQGKIANGNFPAQARGLPDNSSTNFYAIGDVSLYSYDFSVGNPSWPWIVTKNLGTSPQITGLGANSFGTYNCDNVDTNIMTTFNPRVQDNSIIAWLPGLIDPTYGNGFYTGHLADNNACTLGGLVQMATPQKYRTYAQSASVTTTGSWGNSSFYGGAIGLTSTTQNSALSFTVTTKNAVYVGYELQATSTGVASGGSFTVSVDGTVAATVSTGGAGAWTFACGSLCPTSKTAAAVRVPVHSSGQHTIVTNVISATTTANPVTINGVYIPPQVPHHGSGPVVYYGGQAGVPGTLTTAFAAFNAAEQQEAQQLYNDGYGVVFTDVQKYLTSANDYNSSGELQEEGMGHVADAFSAAMQYHKENSHAINPLDYGASCNAMFFANGFFGAQYNGCVHTTATSPVISIDNYFFNPGVATQNGGGDVGKLASISGFRADVGPTATILSVSTTSGGSSATLNENMASSQSCAHMLMYGYPTNSSNLTTASDDTAAIQVATYAAVGGNSSTQTPEASGVVQMPTNCVVHDLRPAPGSTLQGAMGSNDYVNYNYAPTILWAGFTGWPDDVDTATNLPRNLGIDVAYTHDIALKNITISSPAWPYPDFFGAGVGSAVCVGAINTPDGQPFFAQAFLADQVTFYLCPVGLNVPVGWGSTITYTASIAPNSGTDCGPSSVSPGCMTVSAITSSVLKTYCQPNNSNGCNVQDFLSVGEVVTGSGVTSGTKIKSGVPFGLTGIYGVSLSQTVTSEAMHTVPIGVQEAYYIKDSQFFANFWGVNGSMSDSTFDNDVYTGSAPGGGPQGFWYNLLTGNDAANRILGGRAEECGSYCIIMNGNGEALQINGMQFQMAGLGAIQILNAADLAITGGWFNAFVGNPTSFLTLSGSGSDIAVNGMDFELRSTDAIMAVTTGNTVDYVNFNAGQTIHNTLPIFYNNLGGAKPSHLINTIAGYAPTNTYIQPTVSGLSAVTTSIQGGIYSGSVLSGVTTGSGVLTLSGLAPAPNAWNCLGGDQTAGNNFALSGSTSTSCALSGSTTSGDLIWYSGLAH